jgi:hypothetical protein
MNISHLDHIPSSSWNRRYLEQAAASLARIMGKNEDWLLGALLGCNRDWNLFSKRNLREVWRGRDYLYSFMTEKDIQAKLATELHEFKRCHVHAEVPIYGRTNRRSRRKSKPWNFRPDIFLMSPRRREKRPDSKEKYLEITAVEIKYFEKRDRPWMKQMIKYDMGKLYDYLNARVNPRADNGLFVCIDETGEAASALEGILDCSWMRGQRIAYFVLVPKHVTEKREYLMSLEEYQPGLERSSVYVMDKALGMLKNEFPSSFAGQTVKCDRVGECKGSAAPMVLPLPWSQGNWLGVSGLAVQVWQEN